MRILTPDSFRSQPWKNGGGVTHEIVRWPDSADPAAPYDLRISIADDRIEAPFSRFPGYRRWSFLAGPAPIVLDVGGVPHELTAPGDHLEVGGDVAIACRLPAGPTRLLNLLVRDELVATALIGHGPCPSPIRFAYAIEALPWLPAGHAAVFEPPGHPPGDSPATLARHTVWLR